MYSTALLISPFSFRVQTPGRFDGFSKNNFVLISSRIGRELAPPRDLLLQIGKSEPGLQPPLQSRRSNTSEQVPVGEMLLRSQQVSLSNVRNISLELMQSIMDGLLLLKWSDLFT